MKAHEHSLVSRQPRSLLILAAGLTALTFVAEELDEGKGTSSSEVEETSAAQPAALDTSEEKKS